jgi:hypothetical protein
MKEAANPGAFISSRLLVLAVEVPEGTTRLCGARSLSV